MTCERLDDRIFDEDSRAALLGRGEMPEDVALHVAGCSACAQRWSQAVADAQRFSQELLLAPPPALRRRLYRAFRPDAGGWGARIDVEILSHAIAAGALGAGFGRAAGLPDWAGFWLGAGVGLLWSAAQRAPWSWRGPAAAAARTLRSCVELLRPI